ncbi:hypothetical protein GCM10011571_13250 [Marinithermofilum abyssi]|uniref:Uncharacterized protein n=1 Tax=Marinithermofilum abyssi TaxID=1571185 RepID=A0A8J2VH04_9BACL|nr:hypothetical protein GCM10011571_13250 [Marinithermofilum abyssi]
MRLPVSPWAKRGIVARTLKKRILGDAFFYWKEGWCSLMRRNFWRESAYGEWTSDSGGRRSG